MDEKVESTTQVVEKRNNLLPISSFRFHDCRNQSLLVDTKEEVNDDLCRSDQ